MMGCSATVPIDLGTSASSQYKKITEKDIKLIQGSWKLFFVNSTQSGFIFFER